MKVQPNRKVYIKRPERKIKALAIHASHSSLGEHLDAWDDLLLEFGNGIEESNPNMLLVMFKKILPEKILDDIIDEPKVNTYDEIMSFCRRRTDHRREHEMNEFNKKKLVGKARVHALINEDDGGGESKGRSRKDRSEAAAHAENGSLVDEIVAALKGWEYALSDEFIGRAHPKGNDEVGGVELTWVVDDFYGRSFAHTVTPMVLVRSIKRAPGDVAIFDHCALAVLYALVLCVNAETSSILCLHEN